MVPRDWRGNGHIMKKNFPVNIRKHSLYHEGDGALAQATQGSCGVSFLGDIQKLSAHGPRQPNLSGPAYVGGLDKMTSAGTCQSQSLCGSVFSALLTKDTLVTFRFEGLIFCT